MFKGRWDMHVALPKNMALVRVTVGGRPIVLVSEKLTHDQELAARVCAALLGTGQPHLLITCEDLMAALHAAAA